MPVLGKRQSYEINIKALSGIDQDTISMMVYPMNRRTSAAPCQRSITAFFPVYVKRSSSTVIG
jgi:hypothetical protein